LERGKRSLKGTLTRGGGETEGKGVRDYKTLPGLFVEFTLDTATSKAMRKKKRGKEVDRVGFQTFIQEETK